MTRQRQVYTASGSFTPPAGVTSVDVLVVAGGGGGGRAGSAGAGGSGGQVRYETGVPVTPGAAIAVTVGLGGAGRSGSTGVGGDGGSSSFGTLVASGGGGAGAGGGSSAPGSGAYGGGGQGSSNGDRRGATGTVAYKGGDGANKDADGAGASGTAGAPGGGGGAGGPGGDGSYTPNAGAWIVRGGAGGPGLDLSAVVGTDVGASGWFGGGGGGGTQHDPASTGTGGAGGTGGGGAGRADGSGIPGGDGAPNTGGGGGGGSGSNLTGQATDGGTGGSGIVVVLWDEAEPEPGGDTATVTWWDGTAEHTRNVTWWDGTAETVLAEWWDPLTAKLYTIVQPDPPEPLPAGLAAQWTFDDPDNLGAERVAGRTLTLEGATPLAARGGYALTTSGTAARGVAEDGFLSRDGFTVCAWFLPTSATGQTQRVAFLAGSVAVAELYYWYRNLASTPYDVRRASIVIGGVSKNALSQTRDNSAGANRRWHMLAAVYDGALIKLYEDGVLLNSTAATGIVDDPDTFEAYALADGAIDDVEVWDYPFSDAEVTARYEATNRA